MRNLFYFMSPLFLLFICFAEAGDQEESVLYLGDSQSEGYLGHLAFDHFKQNFKESQIQVYGVGSSSPRHWGAAISERNGKWLCKRRGRVNQKSSVQLKAKICKGVATSSAFSYVNRDRPDHVVFQFLGNSVGFSESYIVKKITTLLSQLDEKQNCVFVTSPPHYKSLKENNKKRLKTEEAFISAIGGRCEIVRGMTQENMANFASSKSNYARDKMHLSHKGAEVFFQQMIPYLP